MNIFTHDTPTIDHPHWCDQLHCDAGTHVDVRHSSTPVHWTPMHDDVQITVALHRDDERLPTGGYQPAAVGVSLDVRNISGSEWTGGTGPMRADVFLTPADAERLAHQLLDHAARARGPVDYR